MDAVAEAVEPVADEPIAEFSAEADLDDFLRSLGIDLPEEEGDAQ